MRGVKFLMVSVLALAVFYFVQWVGKSYWIDPLFLYRGYGAQLICYSCALCAASVVIVCGIKNGQKAIYAFLLVLAIDEVLMLLNENRPVFVNLDLFVAHDLFAGVVGSIVTLALGRFCFVIADRFEKRGSGKPRDE